LDATSFQHDVAALDLAGDAHNRCRLVAFGTPHVIQKPRLKAPSKFGPSTASLGSEPLIIGHAVTR
jgi:hypothetical protein